MMGYICTCAPSMGERAMDAMVGELVAEGGLCYYKIEQMFH